MPELFSILRLSAWLTGVKSTDFRSRFGPDTDFIKIPGGGNGLLLFIEENVLINKMAQ